MTETVFSLALALVMVGGITYCLIAILKLFIPKPWRQTTKLGKAFMMVLPLLVGGGLSIVSMESLISLVSSLTGGPTELNVSSMAAFVIGVFAGSFATQIHSAIRSRIKVAAAKAIGG